MYVMHGNEIESTSAEVAHLVRLHEIGTKCVREGNLSDLLENVLETIMLVTNAHCGSVYIIDPETSDLRETTHRGATPRPLSSYESGGIGQDPAAAALDTRHGVLVEDVRTSVYSEPARRALLEAEASACLSTPLLSRSGDPLGVIATYCRVPGRPTDRQVQLVDLFARQAADFIEDSRSREALRKLCANEQEARARADAANRRKDQFLATLSHELRQPLSAALPALEVQKRSLRPERRERAAEVIEQQLHHIARLVEDLSDVSHIARGIVDLRRERLDLRFIVRQALDMTMPLIDARRHRTTVTLGYKPTWVWVDGARMKQVFSNLLRNAASYTPPGGHISISLGRQDGRVFVRVQDNGIGIAADALGPIFEVFERGSQHTDSSSLGIGLAVARQIVELHGGTVSAASDGEGQGSEFVVTLPADEEPSNSS